MWAVFLGRFGVGRGLLSGEARWIFRANGSFPLFLCFSFSPWFLYRKNPSVHVALRKFLSASLNMLLGVRALVPISPSFA